MDKLKVVSIALLVMLLVLAAVKPYKNKKEEEEEEGSKIPIIDAAKTLFSASTGTGGEGSCFLKFKPLCRYFSAPNLDFRGSGENEKGVVTEAVAKSIEKSKEAVEDSAKAAAEFVADSGATAWLGMAVARPVF